jgi:ABC-type transporter Mla subunit MlaD
MPTPEITAQAHQVRPARRPSGARALAALLVLVVAALLAYIAFQKDWFGSHGHLYIETADAAGMSEGMSVTTHGVTIGSVRSIALPAAGQAGSAGVRVELGIRSSYLAQIPKGTQARLVQENAIGKPVIDLVPPRAGGQPVASGEVLAFERARDGSQLVQDVQAALMPVIADARKLTQSLTDPDGSFQQTLKAGQDVAARLPEITAKTGEVIAQTQQAVKTIESGAAATFQKASHTIGVVEDAAPAVIAKVQQAAATSQEASDQMRAMVAQANEKLPGVLDQVQAAATQTNQMVSNARQTWPISLLTGGTSTPASLPIDSIGGLPLPAETAQQ